MEVMVFSLEEARNHFFYHPEPVICCENLGEFGRIGVECKSLEEAKRFFNEEPIYDIGVTTLEATSIKGLDEEVNHFFMQPEWRDVMFVNHWSIKDRHYCSVTFRKMRVRAKVSPNSYWKIMSKLGIDMWGRVPTEISDKLYYKIAWETLSPVSRLLDGAHFTHYHISGDDFMAD